MILDLGVAWLVVLLALTGLRVIWADSAATRIVALDTFVLVLIALLVLFSTARDVSYFLDAALVLALLGFVATVAAARFYAFGRPFS